MLIQVHRAKRKFLELLVGLQSGDYKSIWLSEWSENWKLDFEDVRAAVIALHRDDLVILNKWGEGVLMDSVPYAGDHRDPEFFHKGTLEAKLTAKGREALGDMQIEERKEFQEVLKQMRSNRERNSGEQQVNIHNHGQMQLSTAPGAVQNLTNSVTIEAISAEFARQLDASDLPPEKKKDFISRLAELGKEPLFVAMLGKAFELAVK